jgi:hypothetical protein
MYAYTTKLQIVNSILYFREMLYSALFMMAKFVLILYVPGIPALSMSDVDLILVESGPRKHKK